MDNFEQAIKLIQVGRLDEARIYLEELLRNEPTRVDLLYNLGMCYTELGEPKKGIELLHQCIQFDSAHSNAYVALGFAYLKDGDLTKAKEYSLKALSIDPNNSYAFKNLGGIFGKEGDNVKALYYLMKSNEITPQDPQTVYGLALTYQALGDLEWANKYFSDILEMQAPEFLKDMAKDSMREIAVQELKSRGPRMDVVFYLLDAIKMFKDMPLQEIQNITFEIAMLGQYGLSINDPSEKHVLKSLPGEFTALHLSCIMYAGLKRIKPELDVGIDLSEEYKQASKLFGSEDFL